MCGNTLLPVIQKECVPLSPYVRNGYNEQQVLWKVYNICQIRDYLEFLMVRV